MSNLEELYKSIQKLKELGVEIDDKLLNETNRVEEEIIQNEVIPALSEAIDPIISKIQRELTLIVDYTPNEPLTVKLARKRKATPGEAKELEQASEKETEKKELKPHTKSAKTNLLVRFPDGTEIDNLYASQTLREAIEKIGPQKVKNLNLVRSGINLITAEKDNFYRQHKTKSGYWVMTHTSTEAKKEDIEKISEKLNLELEVKIKSRH